MAKASKTTSKATKISQKVSENAKPQAPRAAPEAVAPPIDPPATSTAPPADIESSPTATQMENGPLPLPADNVDFRPQAGQATKEMTVLLVRIKRGLEHIPAELFKHEVPIMRRIHLEENVEIVDSGYSVVDVPDSAGAEMARLRNKYKQHLDHVDRLFPTVDELARSTGLRNDENEYGKAPESYQEVHRRKPAKG